METGRKILNLRKDMGVPQKSLATQTAVTPSALSRIESGHHQPRGPVALRIARELGVTVDYLLDDRAPYPPPSREIVANLEGDNKETEADRDLNLAVSERERTILEAMRNLDPERMTLLKATLNAPRDHSRYTAFLLGAGKDLPGIDEHEINDFKQRLL